MYLRENSSSSSGTVKAFEDAYAKEEFLRRSAENTGPCKNTQSHIENKENFAHPFCENGKNDTVSVEKRKNPLQNLFLGKDSGDIILLLLIIFFLFDKDSESDSIIPVLLTVLLIL